MLVRGTKGLLLIILLFSLGGGTFLSSHCQVPCGIYDDLARLNLIAEHIKTIEKAMKQIKLLSVKAEPDYNQLVRWVFNKEKHAEDLSQILTYYFMAQRIKPADKKDPSQRKTYLKRLELLHLLLVNTMKAKQTTNLSVIEKMKILLKRFKTSYLPKK